VKSSPLAKEVTVIADRGFGDQALYELLKDKLGFNFIVRFRGIVKVTSAEGETKPAKDLVSANGRPLILRGASVTRAAREVGAVVCLKAKGMKEAWCLATSNGDRAGAEIVKLYGKRFTIEESYRNQKNLRRGMGLSETRISSPAQRDRMLLISAIAIVLITVPATAGEATGLDRTLKIKTVKTRMLSILNQGLFHYATLRRMRAVRAETLMAKFDELIRDQAIFREIFGLM
jgi:hypothetical protein